MTNKMEEKTTKKEKDWVWQLAFNDGVEIGRKATLEQVEKIIEQFWLESEGILGYYYLQELKQKIEKLKDEK